MGTNEFHPSDSGSVLHFDDQAVLMATDIEHNPIIAAEAGIAVLILHPCLCSLPHKTWTPAFAGEGQSWRSVTIFNCRINNEAVHPRLPDVSDIQALDMHELLWVQ